MEEKPAAFSADYADWKIIKTRGVIAITFEVPLKAADHAYNVLNGMPSYETQRRFAIARLNPEQAE